MENKDEKEEQIPTIQEALKRLLNLGTVVGQISAPIMYPDDPIIFTNSPLSAVKELKVNICSTETMEMGVLHQLHTQTRSI
jgi:hypothetical protein